MGKEMALGGKDSRCAQRLDDNTQRLCSYVVWERCKERAAGSGNKLLDILLGDIDQNDAEVVGG